MVLYGSILHLFWFFIYQISRTLHQILHLDLDIQYSLKITKSQELVKFNIFIPPGDFCWGAFGFWSPYLNVWPQRALMAHHVEPGLRHLGLVLQAAMVKHGETAGNSSREMENMWFGGCFHEMVDYNMYIIIYIYIHIIYIIYTYIYMYMI